MKLGFAFLLGFMVAQWCTGPEAAERGYRAGVWTRNLFGIELPTINQVPGGAEGGL